MLRIWASANEHSKSESRGAFIYSKLYRKNPAGCLVARASPQPFSRLGAILSELIFYSALFFAGVRLTLMIVALGPLALGAQEEKRWPLRRLAMEAITH